MNKNKTIYDNSNIAESYAGVTTPLTFSFARYVYQEVYQHFSKMMGAHDKNILKNKKMFEYMIEFIGYRIYYNLNSWYKMLSFFPASKVSSEFMEKMMGVEKQNQIKKELNYSFFQKYFYYLPQTILQLIKITFNFATLRWQLKKFNNHFNKVFEEINKIDLNNLNLLELKNLFNKTDEKLLKTWKTPIANDFAVMVSAGLADKLVKKWLSSNMAYSYMAYSIREPLLSLDPGNKLVNIVKLIQQDKEMNELFIQKYSNNEILNILNKKYQKNIVNLEINKYLAEFGVRMPNELKLESETLTENPENFISIIRNLIQVKNVNEDSAKLKLSDSKNIDFKNLNLLKKIFLKWLLGWAGNSILRREESRFYRTLIFGFVRKIFLEIGKKLENKKIIKTQRDIFYLEMDEIFNIIENRYAGLDPISIIEKRKTKIKKWENVMTPRRIKTSDSIETIENNLLKEFEKLVKSKKKSFILKGRVASCPSNIKSFSGTTLTLKNFDPTANFKGKILVTCQTDPGWTIVFPLLKGIIVERGGMLSHAAIVARELNIPCIVGVDNATDHIDSDTNITVNLQSGEIEKL